MRQNFSKKALIWSLLLIVILPGFSKADLVNYVYQNDSNVSIVQGAYPTEKIIINIPADENVVVRDVLVFVMVNLTSTDNLHLEEFDIVLQSPDNIFVKLHKSDATVTNETPDYWNFYTWYDSETLPSGPGDMDDFNDISSAGEWKLWIILDVPSCPGACLGTSNPNLFKLNISGEDDIPMFIEPNASTASTYSPNAISNFSIRNLTEVSNVFLENNFTTNVTYNATNIIMIYNESYYTYSAVLPAGIHQYKFILNSTVNTWNSTPYYNFTIAKATPTLNLTLNGTETNITIASCESVNATATINTDQDSMWLWLHNTTQMLLTKGFSIITKTIPLCKTTDIEFNFTVVYKETQNYSAQTKTLFATIETQKPTYANNQTTVAPIDDTHWSANFTIEWSDNKNIGNAWLENDFTGNMTNNSMNGSGFYYYNTTLAMGAYQYRLMANDTSDNWNVTDTMTFTLVTTTTTTTTTTAPAPTTTRPPGTGGFPSQPQTTTTTATTSTTQATTTIPEETITEGGTPVIKPEKLPLMTVEKPDAGTTETTTGGITGLATRNPVAATVSLILLIAIAANYAIGVEPIRQALTEIAKKLGLKKFPKAKK